MNVRSHKAAEVKLKLLTDHSIHLIGDQKTTEVFCESFFIKEIHHRAETITPLLKEILEYCPRPQWNE